MNFPWKRQIKRKLERSGLVTRDPTYEQALYKIVQCGNVYEFQGKFKGEIEKYGSILFRGVIEQLKKMQNANSEMLDLAKSSKFVRFLGSGGFGVTSLIESNALGHAFPYVCKHILPVRGISNATDAEKKAERNGIVWKKSKKSRLAKAFASHHLARIRKSVIVQEQIRKKIEELGIVTLKIPEIYMFVEAPRATIVQEYCEGISIFEHCRKLERLEDRLQIVDRVLDAIDNALHQFGIVHCDLKPDNILISKSGIPILIDFDLVKNLNAHDDITLTGEGLGSLRFSHPRQLENAIERNIISDIYTLGRVMWSCALRKYPRSENDFHQYALPAGLDEIFEKTENDRYRTLGEMRHDLSYHIPSTVEKRKKEKLKIEWNGDMKKISIPKKYKTQIYLALNLIRSYTYEN